MPKEHENAPKPTTKKEAIEERDAMNMEMFDDLPKHDCQKAGTAVVAFAPLDFNVMKALLERNASSEEVIAHVKAWIAAAVAENPNPTEPENQRFQAALLANVPFAVYCRACFEPICIIHPEQVGENRP